ncbi:MAG: dTMP kinase [Pantoea sp. Brub]|nr:dTMP kinase [Pantoea sp. Brub]
MNSKFIVLEGLEGAGKTTACNTVMNTLNEYGICSKNIIFTREPGGTPLAEKIRQLIKYGLKEEKIIDKVELLMIYAARVQLVETVIKPALVQGKWVIGDRHDLSSQAYQGGGREFDKNLIYLLKNLLLGNFSPDLTIYLDVEPKIGLNRISSRQELDIFEKESLNFFNKIRNRYLELVTENNNVLFIDANQSLNYVTDKIKESLTHWLKD